MSTSEEQSIEQFGDKFRETRLRWFMCRRGMVLWTKHDEYRAAQQEDKIRYFDG